MAKPMNDADALARRVAEHLRSREGTGPAWGIDIEEAREGYARIAMVVRADMLNGHAIAHGGMIFALADTAFAYACNSRNVSTVANQASIVFLAPAKDGERLVAEAREEALAGRSGVYQVTVRNPVGAKIAVFQGLCRSLNEPVLDPP
ncbi:MAG TPA: hydroxyphenylacetyl-CoA thioesterase PaaI [Rhizomicrobium sp.]|jgi:acyl-CoA thioesterase